MSSTTSWADVAVALVGVSVTVAETVARAEPDRWGSAPARRALDDVEASAARAEQWGAESTRAELVLARALRSMAATATATQADAQAKRRAELTVALASGRRLDDTETRWARYYGLIAED